MLQGDLRVCRRIARAEFVRSLRGYLRDRRRLAGIAVAVLFFGGYLLAALPGAYLLGRSARSIDAIPYLGPVASSLPVALVLLGALRTMERISTVDADDLILTAAHPRAVVVGLIAAEIGRLLLWFGVPLAAVVTAVALGMGSPALLLGVAVVFVPLVGFAAVWGYALGIAVLRGLRRVPTVRRALKIGGILLFVAFIVVSQLAGRFLATSDVSLVDRLTSLSFGPFVAYVELAFAATPLARPLDPAAFAVLAGLLALTPVGLALAVRQAETYWFTDPPSRTSGRETTTASGETWRTGFSVPRPFSWRPSGRAAWGVLVRVRRRPQELSHLLMLVFFVGPMLGTVAHSSPRGLGVVAAAGGVLAGVYVSGAAVGLNPLGDDRPTFPLLLLATSAPERFLRGRTVAGLALGLPLAVAIPLVSVAMGVHPLHAIAFVSSGVAMCLAAALFAPGVGSLYPIYEERELWGVETVAPSTLVIMAYSLVVLSGTGIGLVLTWFAVTGSLPLTGPVLLGVAVYLALTGGVSFASFRYAERRYARYALD